MANLTVSAALLVASLIIVQQQFIESSLPVDIRLKQIEKAMVDRRAEFDTRIQKIFYDKIHEANQTSFFFRGKNYPLLAMAAEVADSEMMLYAFNQRSDTVARAALRHFFKDKVEPLEDRGLKSTRDLMDLVIHRTRYRGYIAVLDAMVFLRKKIYLLMVLYSWKRSVKALANEFFLELDRHKVLKLRAEVEMNDFFEAYKNSVSSLVKRESLFNTMNAVDQIIDEIGTQTDEEGYSQPVSQLDQDTFLARYVDRKLLDDIQSARNNATGHITPLTNQRIENVDLSQVLMSSGDESFTP